MFRVLFGLFCLTLAVSAIPAYASGIPMAESWSWARDGGRIFNATIILGAIAYIVIRFGGPVVRRRADLIREEFSNLEMARTKAESGLNELEEKLKAIKAEGEKIKEEARNESELIYKKGLEQAEVEAKQILEKAEGQIAIETQRARESIRREATLTAINLAEKMLQDNISQQDQKKLIGDYISGMEKIN